MIDAMHILCSTVIMPAELRKAENLLLFFVNEFEELYGASNMVYNVHQLRHIAECVENNGPLFLYSNYSMEDNIGHLVSFVQGTTDVAHQICEKYLLEKNLVLHLNKSTLATKFYEKIESKLWFSRGKRVNDGVVIGNPKQYLNDQHLLFIKDTLNLSIDKQIFEYDSVLWKGEIFYERNYNKVKKRTSDFFVLNTASNNFADISAIFTIDDNLFFLIDEKYKMVQSGITTEYNIFLEIIDPYETKIIASKFVGPKYAFIHCGTHLCCSKFPNLFERN